MTRTEYADLLDWLEARWGKLHAGYTTNPDETFVEFDPYPLEATRQAAASIFKEGRQTCPAPSMLMARTRDVVGQAGIAEIAETGPCLHAAYALLRNPDGTTTAICANQDCRHEAANPAGILTATERAEKADAGRERW